jgi:hypothetical protein
VELYLQSSLSSHDGVLVKHQGHVYLHRDVIHSSKVEKFVDYILVTKI